MAKVGINHFVLEGRVFDMRYNLMRNAELGGVAEGKISVLIGERKGEDIIDEFPIRAYGKRAERIGCLQDGTPVVISGRVREDIRVNSSEPDTIRSKTYFNIDSLSELTGA